MATYTKLSSGSWRVQVRRKGRYVSETFLHIHDMCDVGKPPRRSKAVALDMLQGHLGSATSQPLIANGSFVLVAIGQPKVLDR